MPQTFLEAGQGVVVRRCFNVDDPASGQSGLVESRREDVLPGDDPQHLASGPAGNPCGEQGRSRGVEGVSPATGHLMKRTQDQPTTR